MRCRTIRRIFSFAIVAISVAQVTNLPAATPGSVHKLELHGTEDNKTLVAEIDGHKLSTLSSLEDYFLTLPADAEILWSPYLGHVIMTGPYEEKIIEYHRIIRIFCVEHKIRFTGHIKYI